MSDLRILFMGTPGFACPSLQKLIDCQATVIGVVTQPDRPSGRGQKVVAPPVKTLAELHGIAVFQPVKVRAPEFVDKVRQMAPDSIVVVAFGQILPQTLLDIPRLGCINVHASLLPRYRGAAPINWCIINGEIETGITTMLMDAGLDTGAMLLKRATPINPDEDALSLHDRLATVGAETLAETLSLLADDKLAPEKQDDSLTCYAPMLKKEDGLIDWNKDGTAVRNLVRGLVPWPGAYTYLDGQVLKIHRAHLGNGTGVPGTVLEAAKGEFEVCCSRGSIIIDELQLEGRKRLPVRDFLAGFPVAPGTMLGIMP